MFKQSIPTHSMPVPFTPERIVDFKTAEEYDAQIEIQWLNDLFVIYERFIGNYVDISLLQRNGVEIKMPTYKITGEDVSLEKTGCIKIQSRYFLPIKISSILRKKLGISQREFYKLLSENRI